jgi:dTDP-4-dehydrorhamnose 3,5-epimerase
MQFRETELKEVVLIEPDVHQDARGVFFETYHERKYRDGGIAGPFVQDNFSYSVHGTLRGLHYQLGHPQGKLISVLDGTIFDVAVDIRRGSPSFGRWVAVELSAKNRHQLYVPPGFAHGFCVLSANAAVTYKVTDFYAPRDERGVIWNDPALAIPWPVQGPLLSSKDQAYRTLAEMTDELPSL